MEPAGDVDVYPVGLLGDLRSFVAQWRFDPAGKRVALRRFLREVRKHRHKSSYWNGFLAEPLEGAGVSWTRAGHGWTRARALADLSRHRVSVAEARRWADSLAAGEIPVRSARHRLGRRWLGGWV